MWVAVKESDFSGKSGFVTKKKKSKSISKGNYVIIKAEAYSKQSYKTNICISIVVIFLRRE